VGEPVGTEQDPVRCLRSDLDPTKPGVSACDAAPRTKKDQQGREGPAWSQHPSPWARLG